MRFYYSYKRSILLFLCISLCALNNTNAQQQELVDSLLNEVNISTSDSTRFLLYVQLARAYTRHKPSIAIEYAQKGLICAKNINDYKNVALSYRSIGSMFFNQGKIDQAYDYQSKALETWHQKNIPNIEREISFCLNNLGIIHTIRGDWYEALESLNKGLDLLGNSKKDQQATIEILGNIGVVYAEQKNYTKANLYYEQVLKKTIENKDSMGITIALTNIGEMFYALKKTDKALVNYNKALVISKNIDDIYGIGYLYTNIGIVHYDKGAIELAEDFLSQAMDIANKLEASTEKLRIYIALARIEQKKENYIQANEYCNKGLVLATNMKSKAYIKDLHEIFARNYEIQEDFQQALIHHKLFKEVNDTLFNQEKSRQIEELSIQYETKRKEAENQLLKEEQAKNEALLQRRTILNWTIFLFLVLVSVIAYSLYINNVRKQKYYSSLEEQVEERTKDLKNSNAKLKRSNKDLEQFAYITSHDLKEPLRNISSFTSLIAQRLGDSIDQESKEDISFVQKNVRQMDALIEGVLSYARIKKIDTDTEDVDLKQVISKLEEVLINTIEEKNVQISVGHLPIIKANSAQMFVVLKNLIENAIKYNTTQQPTIDISSKQVDGMYHIEVKDNGIGIGEEYQDKIFTMFKRLHNRSAYDGVGIGLSICRKIIQNSGGDIWVESKEGEGSQFIFSIPVMKTPQHT